MTANNTEVARLFVLLEECRFEFNVSTLGVPET